MIEYYDKYKFMCLSFPNSGRTWLGLMLLELNFPGRHIAFVHGQLAEDSKLLTNDHGMLLMKPWMGTTTVNLNYIKSGIFLWRNPFDILCSVADKHSNWFKLKPPAVNYRKQINYCKKETLDDSKHNFKIILKHHIAIIKYYEQYNIPIYYLSYHDLVEVDTFINLCKYLTSFNGKYFDNFNIDKIKSVHKKYSIDNMFNLPEKIILEENLHRKIFLGPDRDYRKLMPKEHINSLREIVSELDYNNKVAAKFNVVL